MVTTAVNSVFLDTNILVYASIPESPFHLASSIALQEHYQRGNELWVSRQVLREYLAVLTRPQAFSNPILTPTLVTAVQLFEGSFRIAEDNRRVTEILLNLIGQVPVGGRQIHDTNIVATMLAHGVCQLLTHNVHDFARFSQIITVLPLNTTPSATP